MPTSARAGSVYFYGRLNGKCYFYYPVPPSHPTYQGDSVRLRDDVGIVPYILAELRSIQNNIYCIPTQLFIFINSPVFANSTIGSGPAASDLGISLEILKIMENFWKTLCNWRRM